MILPDVLVALLDPGLNGTPDLTFLDLNTFKGDAFQAEGNGDLHRVVSCFYVVCSWHSAIGATKGKKAANIGSSLCVLPTCHCSRFL
jgi:hypothetical protein